MVSRSLQIRTLMQRSLASALALTTSLIAPVALAMPDTAAVDAELRPHFGDLLGGGANAHRPARPMDRYCNGYRYRAVWRHRHWEFPTPSPYGASPSYPAQDPYGSSPYGYGAQAAPQATPTAGVYTPQTAQAYAPQSAQGSAPQSYGTSGYADPYAGQSQGGYTDPYGGQGGYADPYGGQGGYGGQSPGYGYNDGWCANGGGGYPGGYPGGGYPGGYPGGYYPGPTAPAQVVAVDCGDTTGLNGSINAALAQVADGGTVYVRSHGKACVETVNIVRPVKIVGEANSVFTTSLTPVVPTIAAPSGAPCILINDGVKAVEFVNIVIDGSQSGRAACVQSTNADVAFVGSTLRYVGDASALVMSDGQLRMRNADIQAASYDPAVIASRTRLNLNHASITSSSTALFLTPGPDGEDLFEHVSILATAGADVSNTPSTGIMVRGAGSPHGVVVLSHTAIDGFRTGAVFGPGLNVSVTSSRIQNARLGISSDAARLEVISSAISASNTGVYLNSGHAWLDHNWFDSFRRAPWENEAGSDVQAGDNWMYWSEPCEHPHRWGAWCARAPSGLFFDHVDHDGRRGWDGWNWDAPRGLGHGEPRRRFGFHISVGLGASLGPGSE